MVSHEDGRGREDHLEGGKGEDRVSCRQAKRIPGTLQVKRFKGITHD
jgi:hypothetical protein